SDNSRKNHLQSDEIFIDRLSYRVSDFKFSNPIFGNKISCKIKGSCPQHCLKRGQHPSGHDRRNRIGSIMKSIDEIKNQRQNNNYDQKYKWIHLKRLN